MSLAGCIWMLVVMLGMFSTAVQVRSANYHGALGWLLFTGLLFAIPIAAMNAFA